MQRVGGGSGSIGGSASNPYDPATEDTSADDPTDADDATVTDDPDTWLDESIISDSYNDLKATLKTKLGVQLFEFFWKSSGTSLSPVELELPELAGASFTAIEIDLSTLADSWWVESGRTLLMILVGVYSLKFAIGRL